ncbi:MAG: DNA topoisomerase III [Bdellovibrionota bacterium]|nr:DNA topoisomerase III [Bdellovibrionota bacterium]
MKKLILTEKPSVARDFAKSLSIPINRNIKGHFEGPNYIITWALGHLFSPFKPEEYDPTLKKWSIDNLPILPEPFQYSPIAKTKDQLRIIFKILKRSDLEEIIIATDAGREGELIARIILENAPIQNKNNLSFSRFWSSQALSDDVIQKGLQERKSLKSFDRLYHAGKARQIADWLVGMNLSRAATLKWGDLFSIGRVQTAVLWLLVKRNQERKNFKEEKYWKIQGHFEAENISFTAYWFNPTVKDILKRQHILKETELKAILKDLKKHKERKETAVITTDKETEKREPPPPLYSLTDLQQKANRVYGFTAKQTLSLAQELYEKDKCLSYPRTDSQVLGEKNFPLVKNLLNNLKNSYSAYFDKQDASKISLKNKRVFNDSLLTDHHALIPLKVFRGPSQSDKGKIYDLVLRRFIMSFSMDFLFKEKRVELIFGNHPFMTQGKSIKEIGWKLLDGGEREKWLPPIKEKDNVDYKKCDPQEKKTLPPPEYNEASLLRDMVNPARLVNQRDHKNIFRGQVGLGTQSTRAQMIETLLGRSYIRREGKTLKALEKGVFLIQGLQEMSVSSILTSPSETARWEILLEKMAKGDEDSSKLMNLVQDFTERAIKEFKSSMKQKNSPNRQWTSTQFKKNGSKKFNKTILGKCPLCKSKIVEYPKSFSCEQWSKGCPAVIWKEIAGLTLNRSHVKVLLTNGKTERLKGFKSKKGKPFEASLIFSKEGKVQFSFES